MLSGFSPAGLEAMANPARSTARCLTRNFGSGPAAPTFAFADADADDDLVDSAVEIRVRVQLIGHARNNM